MPPPENALPSPTLQKLESCNALDKLRRLRSEVHLIRFPFFALARESRQACRNAIEVRETKTDEDGAKAEILWRVSRNTDAAFPGQFARRLHREVVERQISASPRPIQNPVRLGSFRDICKLLGIQYAGAKSIKAVHGALEAIALTGIRSYNTLFLKKSRTYLNDTFHLYERVIYAGHQLPDGSIADAVYVILGSWYLENLNTNYVVPLDFDYFRCLRGPLASRMYELLHHWFFVSIRSAPYTIERRYSTICSYFPLSRQDTLWKAKQQLREAHAQHHRNGYLASLPEWRPIRGTRKDWTIVYTAGKRALDERRRNQSRRDQDGVPPDELPALSVLALPPASPPQLPDPRRDLAKELELRGISSSIAISLVRDHDLAQVQRQIEAFDWLMAKPDRPVDQNPAGYLRSAIEKDFAPPQGFIPAEERQRRAADEAARLQAERAAAVQAERAKQTLDARLDALWDTLPEPDRQSLRQQARATLTSYAQAALQKEELGGTRGVGHLNLEAEVRKLLASRLPAE